MIPNDSSTSSFSMLETVNAKVNGKSMASTDSEYQFSSWFIICINAHKNDNILLCSPKIYLLQFALLMSMIQFRYKPSGFAALHITDTFRSKWIMLCNCALIAMHYFLNVSVLIVNIHQQKKSMKNRSYKMVFWIVLNRILLPILR